MLSVFPELLSYGLISPFILRIALGVFLGSFGLVRMKRRGVSGGELLFPNIPNLPYKKDTVIGAGEIVVSLLLVIGLFIQIAAIIALPLLFLEWRERKNISSRLSLEHTSFLLATAVALSLLFSTAGFFAFDLPL